MDIEYLLLLQNIRNFFGDSFANGVAYFSDIVSFCTFPLILALFYVCRKEIGRQVLLSFGIALSCTSFLKLVACVYRPWILDNRVVPPPQARITATGYSFPSGHSSVAAGAYGMLAWVCRKKKWAAALFLLLVFLAMLARNILGVHTPQDVLVGCTVGFFGVFCSIKLSAWEEKGKNRAEIVLAAAYLLIALALTYISLKSYPMEYVDGKLLVDPDKMMLDAWTDLGTLTGIMTGWYLEKRFIRFPEASSWIQRIARAVPGIALYYTLRIPIHAALHGVAGNIRWERFLGDTVLFLILMVIYPLIFTAVEKYLQKRKTEAAS